MLALHASTGTEACRYPKRLKSIEHPSLDFSSAKRTFPVVLRFTKLVSLLLAALWLPATLHCQLESLGLHVLFSCPEQAAHTDHASENDCAYDGCKTVESGQIAFSQSKIIPALLSASVCVFVHCLLHHAPCAATPETFAIHQNETLPIQRTWQFTRRAALPARAPDLLNT